MAIVAPTDRPTLARNRYAIELLGGIYVLLFHIHYFTKNIVEEGVVS